MTRNRVILRSAQEFGVQIPPTASAIMYWVFNNKKDGISFAVPLLPPTINHMYIRQGARSFLSKEAVDFRVVVNSAIKSQGLSWSPRGVVLAMIFFESPLWVTKDQYVRDADGDNRLKALFDAIQKSTGSPDNLVWETHYWKVVSTRIQTTVYLYDLGNLVDCYS